MAYFHRDNFVHDNADCHMTRHANGRRYTIRRKQEPTESRELPPTDSTVSWGLVRKGGGKRQKETRPAGMPRHKKAKIGGEVRQVAKVGRRELAWVLAEGGGE